MFLEQTDSYTNTVTTDLHSRDFSALIQQLNSSSIRIRTYSNVIFSSTYFLKLRAGHTC